MNSIWVLMAVASLIFVVASPIWWLNILVLFAAFEYLKMATE